jgi:hypothetical protein
MRKCIQICWILVLAGSTIAAEDSVPTPSGRIVPAEVTWELLFTRSRPISGGLTEGPAVAPDGSIYFSEIGRASCRERVWLKV